MSTPKLQRIMAEIGNRLSAITVSGGYYTEAGQQVSRGQGSLDDARLPGVAFWLEGRTAEESIQASARAVGTVVVEAMAEYHDADAEDVAISLAADIQTAMESTDRTMGGLVLTDAGGGLLWQSDEIIHPEDRDNLVGVRVTYAVPHIRRPGDPIN